MFFYTLVIGSFIKFSYLLIIFRERGRKSATAPGGVALIDARFGVACLRSTPVSPLRICAYAHAIYSLIRE